MMRTTKQIAELKRAQAISAKKRRLEKTPKSYPRLRTALIEGAISEWNHTRRKAMLPDAIKKSDSLLRGMIANVKQGKPPTPGEFTHADNALSNAKFSWKETRWRRLQGKAMKGLEGTKFSPHSGQDSAVLGDHGHPKGGHAGRGK